MKNEEKHEELSRLVEATHLLYVTLSENKSLIPIVERYKKQYGNEFIYSLILYVKSYTLRIILLEIVEFDKDCWEKIIREGYFRHGRMPPDYVLEGYFDTITSKIYSKNFINMIIREKKCTVEMLNDRLIYRLEKLPNSVDFIIND